MARYDREHEASCDCGKGRVILSIVVERVWVFNGGHRNGRRLKYMEELHGVLLQRWSYHWLLLILSVVFVLWRERKCKASHSCCTILPWPNVKTLHSSNACNFHKSDIIGKIPEYDKMQRQFQRFSLSFLKAEALFLWTPLLKCKSQADPEQPLAEHPASHKKTHPGHFLPPWPAPDARNASHNPHYCHEHKHWAKCVPAQPHPSKPARLDVYLHVSRPNPSDHPLSALPTTKHHQPNASISHYAQPMQH